jgi:hypothetical protein
VAPKKAPVYSIPVLCGVVSVVEVRLVVGNSCVNFFVVSKGVQSVIYATGEKEVSFGTE